MQEIALVALSNGLSHSQKDSLVDLIILLENLSIKVHYQADALFSDSKIGAVNAKRRAEIVNQYFKNAAIDYIFDLSGGDIANETICYLDYKAIKKSSCKLFGYSDLTTVINAIYSQTGKSSVLFQVRHLVDKSSNMQFEAFTSLLKDTEAKLLVNKYIQKNSEFIQGRSLNSLVLGGNIRCFLKLAGTPYWPDLKEKILFLESFSGLEGRIRTYFAQLQQLAVFEEISGLILGSFTEFDRKIGRDYLLDIVKEYTNPELSLVSTESIGHQKDSLPLMIGHELSLKITG
ncbi:MULTISPECIES: LD-carboxypeptidase [Aerococcus]|uniref:LD-carboxypeptidase n=1 Tax=Aerococcus urinae (strain CCUG 59500 / ACS-120-V-Col10a) TaxID=2976812 RepID=UPI000200EC0A|nr:LD-carboxypeptidase [Aerococcus sp. Group 1]AEA00973.1 LD-carboxypeptidase [Aerococcus sp. Group 1]MCY3030490.1 LD-carboxypeptidase [Aerococcus sp. Group 1]MCY3054532.1 LD-carboxypeptidase [Aerococcus sp. Group 1]MCY3056262.1 LD-carboxypeptidase [Aerococcus sp. Group 1]MCY3061721.1 LD-carboxypeptidase [Aerococcus sp. Group 1]